MTHKFCHIELNTSDVGAATEFYGELFEWKVDAMPMGDEEYMMVDTGEEPGGGIMKAPVPEMPSCWMVYVQVEDAAATAARCKELGGAVVVEKTPIPGIGFFAMLADPTGAHIGVFEPKGEE